MAFGRGVSFSDYSVGSCASLTSGSYTHEFSDGRKAYIDYMLNDHDDEVEITFSIGFLARCDRGMLAEALGALGERLKHRNDPVKPPSREPKRKGG